MNGERGSVTIVTAAFAAVAVVLAMGTADVARVLVARERARTAADAAALAAAQELALPAGQTPSDIAAEYAARNGALLITCECDAGTTEAVVNVVVDPGRLLLFPGTPQVTATSRAVVDLP